MVSLRAGIVSFGFLSAAADGKTRDDNLRCGVCRFAVCGVPVFSVPLEGRLCCFYLIQIPATALMIEKIRIAARQTGAANLIMTV